MNAQDRKMVQFFQILATLGHAPHPLSLEEIGKCASLAPAQVAGAIEGLKQAGFPLATAEGRWFLSSEREGLHLKEVLGLMLNALVDLPEGHPSAPIVKSAREKLRAEERTALKPVRHLSMVGDKNAEPANPPHTAEPVAIEFTATAAEQIAQATWAVGQRTAKKPDGSVVLSMEAHITPEFVDWLLSFGENAKVLFPFALQQQVEDIPQAA